MEWPYEDINEALEVMSGRAEKVAAGLRRLASAEAQAAQAARQLAGAQRSVDAAPLRSTQSAAASAASGIAGLGGHVDRLIGKRAALREAVGGALGNVFGAAQQLGGPLSMVASRIQNIASLFGRVPPQVAAIIGAVVVLTAVLGGAVAAVYKLGEAAIDVVQKASMLRSVLGALHSSDAIGGKLANMITALGTKLPFATSQIAEWAKSLSMVAQNSGQLDSMIRSTAAAQAIMGESGAAAARKMFETLARGGAPAAALAAKLRAGLPEAREELAGLGLKYADLAAALGMTAAQFRNTRVTAEQMNAAIQKALQTKGAGPLAEMAATWPVIWMKAKEGFSSLFEALGPAVKPFMQSVRSLFGEFARGGVAINVLKPIVTAVFGALFDWGKRAVDVIHKGFLYIVIGALTAYIALRPLINAIAGFVASTNMLRGVAVLFAMMVVPLVLLVGFSLLVFSAIGAIVGIVATLAGALVYTIGAIVGAIAGFVASIGEAFSSAYAAATAAGGSIVDGLVAGVLAGAGVFASAISGLAASGLAAFKGVFGIASPSKVMLEHGEENIAGATAAGVDKGADKVDASMSKLGAGGASAGGGKGGAGGERHYHFHYTGPANQADDFFERAAAWLHGLRDEAGAT